MTIEELNVWRNELIERIEKSMEDSAKPNLKCALLEIRGFLSIVDLQQHKVNVDEAMKYWAQLGLLLKDAPLFPLERFADRLTGLIHIIGEHPQYGPLTQQVDLLLQERSGAFVAAEKCRDRTLAFHDEGKLLKAIGELHNAKVKWFAEESLRGSLLSMILISRGYFELGLLFAAKYYALAAAFISLHASNPEVKPLISKCLIEAAECDYSQGSWCGFLELTDIGLKANQQYGKAQEKISEENEIDRTFFHLSMASYITSRLDSDLSKFVEEWVHSRNLDEWLKDLLPIAHNVWDKENISEFSKKIGEQIAGRPFGDVGPDREIVWSELGMVWKVDWKNDYDATKAAEQIIAILQILLADLAGTDLCIMRAFIEVKVYVDDITDFRIERLPSNVDSVWNVTAPRYLKQNDELQFKKLQVRLLAFATTIILEVSLLPSKRFHDILKNKFKNGLSMKAFVGRSYEFLYNEFIPRNIYESSDRQTKIVPKLPDKFEIKEHKELSWFGGLGPTYSKESAENFLRNRYEKSVIPIRYTLRRLLKSSKFGETVRQLRIDGWLDWHILSAIAMIATNYRVWQLPEARQSSDIWKKLIYELMNRAEDESTLLVPIEEFTLENLRKQLNINTISTLKILDLECHQETPNFDAIKHFLRSRYNYFSDDIEHNNLFYD